PIPTQNVTTALIITDVKLFKFNKTNLDLSAVLLPVLSQPGECIFRRPRPTTSSSLAVSRGISRSMVTGRTAAGQLTRQRLRNIVRVKLDIWHQPANGTHKHSIVKCAARADVSTDVLLAITGQHDGFPSQLSMKKLILRGRFAFSGNQAAAVLANA